MCSADSDPFSSDLALSKTGKEQVKQVAEFVKSKGFITDWFCFEDGLDCYQTGDTFLNTIRGEGGKITHIRSVKRPHNLYEFLEQENSFLVAVNDCSFRLC
jgi:hypothetical protein